MLLTFSMVVVAFAIAAPVSVNAGCMSFPDNGKTGNNACIDAYGDSWHMTNDGDWCCFSGEGKAEGRSITETEILPLKKRALGCRDGCQPYPSGSSKSGNNACIDAYGNMFRMSMDTWGDRCCPSGCGKAEGRSITEETQILPLKKRALGCRDGCQPYPSGSSKSGNNACIDAYGNMFQMSKDTWGDRCCPSGCGKAEGRSITEEKQILPLKKRALGCRDGCQPYPSGSSKTGNNACIDKYGDMFRMSMNTWGDQCCPSGCGSRI